MQDSKREILKNIYIVYLLLMVVGIVIFIKVLKIQFVEGDHWKTIAKKQTLRYDTIFAIRGNIFSDEMRLLATTVPIFDVSWDSKVVADSIFKKSIDALADSLSGIFPDKSKNEYKSILREAKRSGNRDLRIRIKVNYDELNRIKKFPVFCFGRNSGGLKAEPRMQRVYPYNALAYRTIGWDKEGTANDVGLEDTYSKLLQGVNGRRLVKKISKKISIPINDENKIDPQNGKDIVSTLNINIQDVAESALRNCIDTNKADWGCAILMEVATGHIKAIANLKHEKDGTYKEAYNYSIGRKMDPGSTFKLVSSIAVLEEGVYDTGTLVNTGIKSFDGKPVEDSHPEGYGRISLKKAFEKSSNVGIAEAVVNTFGKNRTKINKYFDRMRVNQPLGIELSGEAKPRFVDPQHNLPRMAFGYSVEMTPLQILTFYNAIANNGKMVKPLFVSDIMLGGQIVEHKPTVVLRESVCSEKTLKKIKKMLEGVVLHGTAHKLKNSLYSIAGKTGTAKIYEEGIGYVNEYNASFVGYFPADNPKYTCIVVVSRPKKALKYGAELAAPVFKEIADRVYATKLKEFYKGNVQSVTKNESNPILCSGKKEDIELVYQYFGYHKPILPSSEWVQYNNNLSTSFTAIPIYQAATPDVRGLGAKNALFLLEKTGYKINIIGKGKVTEQSIVAGTPVKKGEVIYLKLGKFTKTPIPTSDSSSDSNKKATPIATKQLTAAKSINKSTHKPDIQNKKEKKEITDTKNKKKLVNNDRDKKTMKNTKKQPVKSKKIHNPDTF